MTRPAIALRHGAAFPAGFAPPVPPALVNRARPAPAAGPGPGPRRTRLWEFDPSLHCSILGTCLSAGELRHILAGLGLAGGAETDHALHGAAVTAAGRHDAAGKRLHKALDARHRLAIKRFARAADADAVGALWREGVRQGDIPGAYWATLTHPAATRALIREAFGEVHMLSHLVGAANRADIRRLHALEQDRAELQARLARQQAQLRDAVVTRDARIRALEDALAARLGADGPAAAPAPAVADETLRALVRDLQARLGAAAGRHAALERRLAAAEARADGERAARAASAAREAALRAELAALEAGLAAGDGAGSPGAGPDLGGLSILYVGGRPGEVARLRRLGERAGATLLHHDGGVEESADRLAALARRADLVLFPVDCISHGAVSVVKRLCRQAGKRYVPLRSGGAGSFLAALAGANPAALASGAQPARSA